jgi:3-phenylpropionate/trans-cinnamate dioxygenase ferredoxin subunit
LAEKFVVARTDDIPEGERLIVDVNGRSVGIFHVGSEYYALLNRCPHQGAELCKGDVIHMLESDRPGQYRFDLSRPLIACPWHGWEFELATGQSYFDPARTRVRPYRVVVETGAEVSDEIAAGEAEPSGLVKGPYTVETLPVSIEDDYVVVTLSRST